MAKKFFVLILGLGFLMLISCGGGGGSSSGGGSTGGTPQLLSFALSPSSAPLGRQTTLTFNFAFSDSGGDLDGGSIILRDDETNTQVSFALPATYAGVQSGTGSGFIIITPGPNRGNFTTTAWLIDKKGNRSNTITVPFTVT